MGEASAISQKLLYDHFILFGDSITQHSFSQKDGFAFGAQLLDGLLISYPPPSKCELEPLILMIGAKTMLESWMS